MIKITNKKMCCGCTACYAICPTNCISMVEDSEGYHGVDIIFDKNGNVIKE